MDRPGVERRPIAVRSWRIFDAAARGLARRGVSADGISLCGLACGIGAGVALAQGGPSAWGRLLFALGAGLVLLRLLSNLLDGMVAVGTGTASPTGELWNEVPDRVSDAVTLIGLGYAAGGHVTLGFAAALLAVGTAYVRAASRVAGAPQDYRGPMAKQQRMAIVVVTALACSVMPENRLLPWGVGLPTVALVVIALGSLVTACRRLLRASLVLRSAS